MHSEGAGGEGGEMYCSLRLNIPAEHTPLGTQSHVVVDRGSRDPLDRD